jgi:glycyl-tRNA synthetase
MTQPLDFQNIIMTLQHFWAERGCLIWQPYYTQVGAGTMNPGTFLRVLGPEPWNIAYVEPSIRPDDARYGENPNRMQMHYQFQVILKPDPGNPQELYIRSLEALGIDPRLHDLRFVEDNWESPALGAWGLGWEVWLDGQEITQFTYFQQAGGVLLDPVSVEMTYGLDRIAIALQRVRGFTEVRWNTAQEGARALTAGDVNLQAEQEHSKYYFEVADVARLQQMYDLFEAEARDALQAGLVLPAHDYVLKCSHTFNVLDSRGAIGVTERQAYFGRMRELSRQVAEAYLAGRQRMEYPFEDAFSPLTSEFTLKGPATLKNYPNPPAQASPAPFLFEIGTEELPAGDLQAALAQLEERLPALLDELRLSHGPLRVMGTPRRLVISVQALAPFQADLEQIVKGPPANRAYDALNQPTRAAEGFARSKGVSVSDLQVRAMDGGQYVVAVVRAAGRPASQVLAEALPALIRSLRFDKTMRWNSSNEAFSRPVRWLLALHGEHIVPFSYAGVDSNNLTRGLRFRQPVEIPVRSPSDYFAVLAAQDILLDGQDRREHIVAQIARLAASAGGSTDPDPDLLAEVVNLVEFPTGLRGSFDPAHLQLPREVLISVMKKHQRYFPVVQASRAGPLPDERPAQAAAQGGPSQLLPYFITIRNGDTQGLELVVEGNEHVIRARFADAAFFVNDDLKKPLPAFLPRLGTLTFQTRLGSMLDKTRRIRSLVETLVPQLGLSPEQASAARRAAELCKADLATKMVIEMTDLEGLMGRYYALRCGETQEVAEAIFEHYLPRFAGDAAPATRPGLAVGVADRLDTLAGLFAAGLAPTGAKDPFAQRRAALGLVSNLIAWELDFDLRAGLRSAAQQLPIPMQSQDQAACLAFMVERLRNLLLEQGGRFDVVDAVLAAQGHNPAGAARAVRQLAAWVERPDWRSILPAFARCVRITRDLAERYPVDAQAFTESATRQLFEALLVAEAALPAGSYGSPEAFLQAFLPMIPAVNHFFDAVLVMAEDPLLRQNRLGLLQRLAALSDGVADMSRLEGF